MTQPPPNDTAESLAIKALNVEVKNFNDALLSAIQYLPQAIAALQALTAELHALREYAPHACAPIVESLEQAKKFLRGPGR